MPRYIDAEELLHRLPDHLPYKASVRRVLIQAPSADVQEVRRGKWINENRMYGTISAQCSVCGLFSGVWLRNAPYKYCPYCGSKMDEGGNEE